MSKRSRSATPAGSPPSAPSTTRTARHDRSVRAWHDERPFLVRHRTAVFATAVAAIVAVVGGFFFLQSTQKLYACSEIWQPSATTNPASGRLGEPQDDQGRGHLNPGDFKRYTLCPPASGQHYASPGGPIAPRFYGPNDETIPQGWVHNLEHGGLVVLYSCGHGGCGTADLDKLRALTNNFPNSPVCAVPAGIDGPVVTRFEEMPHPFAALVWDRVLYQDTLDTNQILKFFATEGERGNPEPQCQASPSPSPS